MHFLRRARGLAPAPRTPGPTDPPDACRPPAGRFEPVIDRNRCEAKGPCVAACPTQVLAIGVLSAEDRRGLGFAGRVKAFAHGHRQAFAIAPDRCEACGACVRVCPERAISLRRRASPPEPPSAGRRPEAIG
jgi:NAD-dependent dihydropyrimidine dehydrogenase PreA subunit